MNNTNLTIFDFNNNQVRVITIKGEPWFVAKDVCTVLEVGNVSQALTRLDEDEKGIILNDTPGGKQEVSIVSESGLYALVLSSRKPQAKPFRKWVTSEVLPSIRKTGSYSVYSSDALQGGVEKALAFSKLLENVYANVQIDPALVAGLKLNASQRYVPELAEELEPARQLLINCTAKQSPLVTPTELGKDLGLSAVKVNKLLIDKGLQIENPGKKSKKDPKYVPTFKAKGHCSFTLATGTTGADSFQQLRWYKSVLKLIR